MYAYMLRYNAYMLPYMVYVRIYAYMFIYIYIYKHISSRCRFEAPWRKMPPGKQSKLSKFFGGLEKKLEEKDKESAPKKRKIDEDTYK